MERLSPEARGELLGELRRLVTARGGRRLLEVPILEPTPRHFPDPYRPDAEGARVILRRLLDHVGLGHEVELEVFEQAIDVRQLDDHGRLRAWGHEGSAASFAGLRGDRCRFAIAEEQIREPAILVATLCHEVAQAWRSVHRLAVGDPRVEETLTSVSTVYLGFGLLTANGSYVYRQGGELTGGDRAGTIALTRWSHARAGFLSPEAMSFLLAAQLKVRRLGWWARRRLVSRLEPTQAACFRWSWRRLGDPEQLRWRLGLPPPDLFAPAR